MLTLADTQIVSIGVLELFLWKVAGSDAEEWRLRMKLIIPSALSFTTSEPVLTFSLWTMPRMTLSLATSLAEIVLHRSSAKRALGFGFCSSLVSLKKRHYWFQKDPGFLGVSLDSRRRTHTKISVLCLGIYRKTICLGHLYPHHDYVCGSKTRSS